MGSLSQILFVFAGTIENSSDYASVLFYENESWRGVQNEAIHFADDVSFTLPYYICRKIDSSRRGFEEVAINHTCSISELKDYFGLSERDVPALVFTPTHKGLQNKHIKVSVNQKDIYQEIKEIVQFLDKPLYELKEVQEKYKDTNIYLQSILKQIKEFDQKPKVHRQYIYSKIKLNKILSDDNYKGDKGILLQAMKTQIVNDWQLLDQNTKSILKKYLHALKKRTGIKEQSELDIIELSRLLSEEDECIRIKEELQEKVNVLYDEMIVEIKQFSSQLSFYNDDIGNQIKEHIFREIDLKNNEKNSFEAAFDILKIFKEWVETNRGWNLIQNTASNRREKDIQRLIHLVAKSYVEFRNLDISFESDAGRGPLDFKVSRGNDKTIVEVKLSTNDQYLHGYGKQIREYGKAENTNQMIYMYIDLGNPTRLEKIIDVYKKDISIKKTGSKTNNS